MGNFWLKHALRGVSIKKETLVKYIDSLDTDENGIIDLVEVGLALKFLWKKAKGKIKEKKQLIIGE